MVANLYAAAVLLLLTSCRGEPVPRDFQNSPPGLSNPADSRSQTPTAQGQPVRAPEPSSGAEGTSGPYQPVEPSTTAAPTPGTAGNPGIVPPSTSTKSAPATAVPRPSR